MIIGKFFRLDKEKNKCNAPNDKYLNENDQHIAQHFKHKSF